MTIMTLAWQLEKLAWAWQGCTVTPGAARRGGRDVTSPVLRGKLEHKVPMKKRVSWRAGGAADRAYTPKDVADLAAFLQSLPAEEAVCCVGLGSNLLVRDGGFRGTVVFLHAALSDLFLVADGLVYAQAGVASPKVARFAAVHSLAGAEFLAGIPGTVGGALAMNAGCFGAETWQRVERVETVNRQGRLRVRVPGDYEIGYRHLVAKSAPHAEGEEYFTGAWFRFVPGDEAHSRSRIRELLTRRIATQPLELPNAGSVFRNPPNDHAARLIEACGLKGLMMGGARVSEKHANFIVNPGGAASARDIETLIGVVRDTVRRQQGVELIPEVRIVGEMK